MPHVCDVPAVGEELAANVEWSQRARPVQVDVGLRVSRLWVGVLVVDAGLEVERSVAHGARVTGAVALAVELARILKVVE